MLFLWSLLNVYVPFKTFTDIPFLCDNNFTTILGSERNSFIFFKSATCPHCKEFTPVYDNITVKYSHKTKFYIVMYETCPAMASYYKVTSFPTLISARYGRNFTVCHSRDENGGLKDFLEEKFIETGKYLETAADVVDIINSGKNFFLCNHRLSLEEKYAADSFTLEHSFYSVDDFDILKKIVPGYKPKKSIIFYRSSDRQFIEVSDIICAREITEFIEKHEKSPVSAFSVDNVNDVFIMGSTIAMVKFDKKRSELDNDDYVFLDNAARSGIKVVYFTIENSAVFDDVISPPQEVETPLLAVVKMQETQTPRWINIPDEEGKKLKPEIFIKGVISGKIKKYIKSEDIPRDNSSPIKKLVGKNFKSYVEDSNKPTVILFYSTESYAVDVLAEKLVDSEFQFGTKINFGMFNTALNEIFLKITEPVPVLGFYYKGKIVFYGEKETLCLNDWISQQLNQYNEL